MLYNTLERDKPYLWGKFQRPEPDPATGLDNESIKAGLKKILEEMHGAPHSLIKARGFEYIVRNVRIDVSPHDWFAGFGCWDRKDRLLGIFLNTWAAELRKELSTAEVSEKLNASGAVLLYPDFDHSVPDWDAVFSLGFSGLRERARTYRRKKESEHPLSREEAAYFDSIEVTYSAISEMLERFRRHALEHADGHPRVLAVAECLAHLRQGPPGNTLEALELIYLYFIFGEHIDHMQVRSLGNLDRILYPYYRRDLESKTFEEAHIREFIDYFLMQFASINNYWGHPFYLGGTRADGGSEFNELSLLILEEFEKLNITSPKIQLKIADSTPAELLDKALDMVRRHNSSLVFVSENAIQRAFMGLGFSPEEARTCDVNGCYEYDVRGREVKTAPIYLNLLKPVELVFFNGVDPGTKIECGCRTGELETIRSFDDFYHAYFRQLDFLLEQSFRCADEFEKSLHEINPGPVFSATIENSLKVARDAFSNGSVYNNTVVLHTGLATAADALEVVRDFVFERKLVTLEELREALQNNWKGYEKLRLKILRSPGKYGNGSTRADSLAEAIAHYAAAKINLRPNARGGFYKAGMHSARTFLTFGEHTGATPDGRKAGDEMSKNVSPAMGMDAQGVTALMRSASLIDSALFPADYCLDVMLHPAAVEGRDGLSAMKGLLSAYRKQNGASLQFNIFNAETLLDAQKHPEHYPNLQVRVCGWNVRFNDLCRKEQDAYIERAKNIRE
ncbi:MAG: Benzylsuccinate synthase alpha subunit [Lentisphaerae bacterium ADurb.Bin242]|nr:MAG: Benzylsuccinate synthase alpha subunit [Lentisphaerae bacterium ADurb.Bin242]